MRLLLLLFIITLVSLSSCRHTSSQDKTLLSRADMLISDRPDSVLLLLQTFRSPHQMKPSDFAHYAFLKIQAFDKCNKIIESDSLINAAIDYYTRYHQPGKVAYAYLYLSRYARNRGDAQGQATALLKAIPLAIKSNDDRLLGYIYGEKASIYETQQSNDLDEDKHTDKGQATLYEEQQKDSMLLYNRLSLIAFQRAKDWHNYTVSLIDIGYSHYLCHQYDSAIYYCRLAERKALQLKEEVLLTSIYRVFEGVYFYQKDYAKARQYIRMAMRSSDAYDYSKWRLLAMIDLQTGELDSAHYYLKKCVAAGKELPECYLLLQDLYEKQGDNTQALHYAKLAAAATDSVDMRTRADSFAGLEKKYNNERMAVENKQLTIKNQRRIIEIILVLLICAIITLFYFTERARKKRLAIVDENLRKTLAIKDKFISIISHDLRNPAKAITFVLRSLYENYTSISEEKRLETIKSVSDAAEQAGKLLENLLLWSLSQRIDIPFHPRNIELSDLINNCIELFTLTASKKNIRVVNNITKSFDIEADLNMTTTIIGNLLNNAIKYSYPGGEVTISAREEGKFVAILIADTGIGINDEDCRKLFCIDSKIKHAGTDNETGTGLGLILCREFVEKQGGTIRVESEPGKGSVFIFTVLNVTDHEPH